MLHPTVSAVFGFFMFAVNREYALALDVGNVFGLIVNTPIS